MIVLVQRFLICIAIAALSGCAATVVKPTDPGKETSTSLSPSVSIPPIAAKKLILQFSASDQLRARSDWASFVEEWENSLTALTTASNIGFAFPKDEKGIPDEPATLINVKVNDFKYVSQVKRYMIGIMAGNASMDVDVEYFELPAKLPLGTRKFSTTSSAWEGVFSAMTPKQVNAVSTEIVRDFKTGGTNKNGP